MTRLTFEVDSAKLFELLKGQPKIRPAVELRLLTAFLAGAVASADAPVLDMAGIRLVGRD